MVPNQIPADQASVYPCDCYPERLSYCSEWWRLSKQYAAAFEAFSDGGLTWDECRWFADELEAHEAAWSGWAD